MDAEDLDNDSSDEDYMPEGADNVELPSEEESDGEPEDEGHVSGDETCKKRNKRSRTSKVNKRTKIAKTSSSSDVGVDDSTGTPPINEEDQKKKTDSLWADFLKDTTTKRKDVSSTLTTTSTGATTLTGDKASATVAKDTVVNTSSSNSSGDAQTVTVQTVYEFAGEQVIVNKVIPAPAVTTATTTTSSSSSSSSRGRSTGVRGARGGGGGLSSVLQQLGKKQKISTLEKSKLDWDRFKQDENITEELSAHNKGRHGYLERQDFLQRADQRQFELEKEMRTKHRSHRI